MKKISLTVSAFLAALTVSSSAYTVLVSDFSGSGATFTDNPIKTSTGASFATGAGLVRVGFFGTLTPTQVTNLFDNEDKTAAMANITANFVPLGEARDPDLGAPGGTGGASPPRFATRVVNGVSQTGRLAGSVINIVPTASVFDPANIAGVTGGTRLYMIIYDASTAAAANEVGIFSSDNWNAPSDNLVNPTLNTVDVSGAEIFLGSSAGGALRLSSFVPIPEPSTGLLGLLAGLGLVARRRR